MAASSSGGRRDDIEEFARYLGLPLIDNANTTGNVCPSCGFAFDDPADLNEQA